MAKATQLNTKLALLGALSLMGIAASAPAVTIDLAEYAFNRDGVVMNGSFPGGVNAAGFDSTTGLGTVMDTFAGAGYCYVALFVDHEIDEAVNTFFNELGFAHGTPAAGQTWEIDEPGWGLGDIYDNFLASALDNTVLNGAGPGPEDISMALGWAFVLGANQRALVNFHLSNIAPTSGFYLEQNDPDSGASIYFSSGLDIVTIGAPDGGSMMAMLTMALAGLAGLRRRL